MDTVQMVIDYLQFCIIEFLQFLQEYSNVIIAFFAGGMLWNAWAVKKLEETNLRISLWPELKKIILAIDKYIFDVSTGDLSNSFRDLFAYINVVQFAPYLFQEEDEIILRLDKLKKIGSRMQLLHATPPLNTDADEVYNKWNSDMEKERNSLNKEANEIKNILKRRNNLAISTHKSWFRRLFNRREN